MNIDHADEATRLALVEDGDCGDCDPADCEPAVRGMRRRSHPPTRRDQPTVPGVCDVKPMSDEHLAEIAWDVENYYTVDQLEVGALLAEVQRLRAIIARVRDLHTPIFTYVDEADPIGGYVCDECGDPTESEPCATVRALDGEQQ